MSLRLSNIISFETFRRDGGEWWRFAWILFLVLVLPLPVLFLIVEVVGWRTGELMSPAQAAQMQVENPLVKWQSLDDANGARFKLIRVAQERPEVLVIGSSRVCQFRRTMFQPYSFYNLSRVTWLAETYPELFRRLPEGYKPKVIIFGLDFFMFNHRYTTDPNYRRSLPQYAPASWRDHFLALRNIYTTLCNDPGALFADGHDPINGEPVIGLRPSRGMDGAGFRQDGSEAQKISDLKKYDSPDRDMLKGNILNRAPLYYGDAMGKDEMASFEEFVAEARAQGITLIGVQMPMYGPLVRYMEQGEKFGILRDFRAHIAGGYFDRLGVKVFDLLSFPPYSEDPKYFVDAWHPTEPVSAAALFVMQSDPKVKALLPAIDMEALKQHVVQEFAAPRHIYLNPNGD